MDEGGEAGEPGPVQFEREEDPFDLDQFLNTVAWRASTSGGIGSGSSSQLSGSGGDGGDMNM